MKTLTHSSIVHYSQDSSFLTRYDHISPDAADKILRYGAPLGSKIEHLKSTPRCMTRIQELINQAEEKGTSLPCGTVVLADELKSGSGRFGREWYAPSGGIWMALAWADNLLPDYARLLPLAAGTACCEAIRNFGVQAMVKWVNDIHVDGRKIGGILCETFAARMTGERFHIIGVGINCNVASFPWELRKSAVSMHDILGCLVDLDKFALELMARFSWNLGLVHFQEEMELMEKDDENSLNGKGLAINAWEKLSDSIGRRVVYGYDVMQKPLYKATVRHVERSGALVMELDNGESVTEHSGEIIYLN